jgi:hypothetical protein
MWECGMMVIGCCCEGFLGSACAFSSAENNLI